MADDKKDKTASTAESSATQTKAGKGRRYVGPSYKTKLVVGKGSYDPKSWDAETIERMIKLDDALTRYFD